MLFRARIGRMFPNRIGGNACGDAAGNRRRMSKKQSEKILALVQDKGKDGKAL